MVLHDPDGSGTPHILVVEDDLATRQLLVKYLEDQMMRTVPASGRHEMALRIGHTEPGLIILGLQRGQRDGLALLRQIRAYSCAPVIIADGDRRSEIERAALLEFGADDCVDKPLCLRELLARIRAILRRQPPTVGASRKRTERGRYRFGNWMLNRETRRLMTSDETVIELTNNDYALLIAFLDTPQRILTRGHLTQATRRHADVSDRSIDVQVLRLRRKLEGRSDASPIIHTVRGIGYVFMLPVVPSF
jgi:two-component system, OmpR family, response regulator